MKNLLKKNQVIITALAIMIAVAGYLNFTSDKELLNTSVEEMESEGASGNQDDALVSAALEDDLGAEELAAIEETTAVDGEDLAATSLDENGEPIDATEVGEAVLTGAEVSLSQIKLNREQTRSREKEILLEIINNTNLSEDSKKDAIDKMLAMTERMEKENAAETQLAAKGFSQAIVNISDASVDVTIYAESLSDEERTQIEDIIIRKTGCELTDIVLTTISNVSQASNE